MPVNWPVTISNDEWSSEKYWQVGAFTICGEPKHYPNNPPSSEHAEIIIPICQLEGLSSEQIGDAVLDLIPLAKTCYADHVVDSYLGSQQEYHRNAPDRVLAVMVLEDLPLIESHRDDEFANKIRFDEAIAFLREMKGKYEFRQSRRLKKVPEARKSISHDYDATFMRIGRRDGFHCGVCKATKNLQLDHVRPVSYGGCSEDENLQLLCGSCNSFKGDKTLDYRDVGNAA